MRSLTEAHGYTTDKCLQITTHGLTPSYKHSSRPTHASFKSTGVSNGNLKAPHWSAPWGRGQSGWEAAHGCAGRWQVCGLFPRL